MNRKHDVHRQRQQTLLDRVLAVLRGDPRVLGVVLVGSYARGQHDAFSDLDVGCYLRDEQRTGWNELYDRVATVAPLLCHFWLYDVHALYLFEDGVRLDLDFYRPGDVENWHRRSQSMILYDPNGFLADQQARGDLPDLPQQPAWAGADPSTYVDWFLWMFRQIVCWAKRGAQGGRRAFTKLSGAADSLHQVRASLMAMRLWTLSSALTDSALTGGADCLAMVDPACAQRLAASYPHLSPDEVIACAHLLLDEYTRICPDYCARAGVPYPARKVETLRRLLAEFEALA